MPAPAPPAATTGSQPDVQAPPQEPKKKRSFWSRLFGIGKGGDKDDRDKDDRDNDKNDKNDRNQKSPKKKGGL